MTKHQSSQDTHKSKALKKSRHQRTETPETPLKTLKKLRHPSPHLKIQKCLFNTNIRKEKKVLGEIKDFLSPTGVK